MTVNESNVEDDPGLTCDVLVVGSGAGGLCGALTAATLGLDVLLIESTEVFGGTTAYSGGGMWLPNNPVSIEAGVPDSLEITRTYLDAVVDDESTKALREAFIETAPKVVEELIGHPEIELEWKPFPDYFPGSPGFLSEGRDLFPVGLQSAVLGPLAELVRSPLPESRGGHDTGTLLSGGRALIGRLLHALEGTSATLLLDTPLEELTIDAGRVVGAMVQHDGRSVEVRATRGVLLAAGGFERNIELRQAHGHPIEGDWSMGSPGAVGTAIDAGLRAGARTQSMGECWWTPAFDTPDGPAFRVRDRGNPGSIMVDQAGRRFVNESLPYDRVGRAMEQRARAGELDLPCWFVVDQGFLDRYGINGSPAGERLPENWYDSGFVFSSETIDGLAEKTGVSSAGLGETVERFNTFAEQGTDDDFGRGGNEFDLFFGDPSVGPNTCLALLSQAPFHAFKVVLSDLGTKGGLDCDTSARVLDESAVAIPGLYATGNSMAPWSGSTYPAPGVPIATSMVFAHIAAHHMASSQK